MSGMAIAVEETLQPEQLDHDVDEFAFRFKHRTSRSRGILFCRLLQQAAATDFVTYQDG